ncbi:MAG: hypothetical protein FJX77_16345 [Armatimonadetes bacterium]|nr:hypothetical protein [Armatimonadota bacterium]
MRFHPAAGFMGDPIPFYHNGEFHLFYLRRVLPEAPVPGCPWGHAVSRDLVHWETLPDVVSPGAEGEPDCGDCWTGSVIERSGTFHAFYTGHAPHHPTRPQSVCRATSTDLIHWQKDPANPILLPPPDRYEHTDWRDPFVFFHAEEGCYWMVITCRLKMPGDAPRRGCLTVATSPDLERWEVQAPIWSPSSLHAPECPDLWQEDGRWRLLFSNGTTQSRVAPTPFGPWRRTSETDADGRWFYAAKCFHAPDSRRAPSESYLGRRHLLVGWVASREGSTDAGTREWGGTISLPREAFLLPDGGLGWRAPAEIADAWNTSAGELQLRPVVGSWTFGEASVGESGDGFALALAEGVPDSYRLETWITPGVDQDAEGFRQVTAGLLLRYGSGGDGGYVVALEPGLQRVAVRQWQRWGDPEPMATQYVALSPGEPVHLDLYLDGSVLEVFVADRAVISARCYDHTSGHVGLWVQDGRARFAGTRLLTPS